MECGFPWQNLKLECFYINMISINGLRQIVNDMHAVFPGGIRKNLRIAAESKLTSNPIDCLTVKGEIIDRMKQTYFPDNFAKYWQKIQKEEEEKLIKSISSRHGFQFKNQTNEEIDRSNIFEVLKGVLKAEKAGLKMPKNIIFKDMDYFGEINPRNLDNLYLNPKEFRELATTTVHEITHKNDKFGMFTRLPVINFIMATPGGIITLLNRSKISKAVTYYASMNREEFIACTAEKLICENKTWSDLDPKIKKLYDFFNGPRLKLDGGKG